jgi:hypothetical protein
MLNLIKEIGKMRCRRGLVVSYPPAELWVVRSNPAGFKSGSFIEIKFIKRGWAKSDI